MKLRRFDVGAEGPGKGSVVIDGLDISNMCRAVQFDFRVGSVPCIDIELSAGPYAPGKGEVRFYPIELQRLYEAATNVVAHPNAENLTFLKSALEWLEVMR